MPKFKVGDTVRGLASASSEYAITTEGFEGKIISIDRKFITITTGKYSESFMVNRKHFEIIPSTLPLTQVQQKLNLESKIKCSCCKELFDDGNVITIDGDKYCNDCEIHNFIVCESCNAYCLIEDSINKDGHCFCCISCANNNGYYQCADCSDWVHNSDAGTDADHNYVCSSCSNNYSCCDSCSDAYHNNDLTYNENGNRYYCESCRENNSNIIKPYAYRPLVYAYEKMAWENTIYLGIELEVECGNKNASELATKAMGWLEKKSLDKRVYIKEDGSLSNGFEIVFHPTTLQAFHKKFPMRDFLKYLKHIGCTSHENGTCGLHVHISRSNLPSSKKKWKLTANHLWAGKLFFFRCKDYIESFSTREDMDYCNFDNSMPSNGHQQDHGRYSAFNTAASRDTVEIRIFRGTLMYERFLASLQFSDCFANYIQNTSVAFLKSRDAKDIWASFLTYAKKGNKYNQMNKYMIKKGII